MGSGTFSSNAYRAYSSTTVGKSTDEIYSSRSMSEDLNPHGVKVRESRDSEDNPNSTPIIVGLDVTASMGMISDVIAREGLGTLFESILERKPISDPHVMFMGIGDAHCDSCPLQVSQFEADMRVVEQLSQLYLENGGGGNDSESYNFPWYFAGFHTAHDSFEKRGKRGYLFTIGDECAPQDLTKEQIKRFIGSDIEGNMTSAQMLEIAERSYDVYHIIIEEGHYARHSGDKVKKSWADMLGQKAISLSDHTLLAETIVSIIEVAEGASVDESIEHWGTKADVVKSAVGQLTSDIKQPKRLGQL